MTLEKVCQFWGTFQLHIKINEMKQLPIPKASFKQQEEIISIVDEIIKLTKEEGFDPKKTNIQQRELERKVNEKVMDLYLLNEEEKEIIRGK